MNTSNNKIVARGLFSRSLFYTGIIAILSFASCNTTPAPLPDGAANVKIVTGTQEVSIDLFLKCRPIGTVIKIGPSSDPFILQRVVVEKEGNTAQVLYTEGNTRQVRIWNCPRL
jgi:hypothetical protein